MGLLTVLWYFVLVDLSDWDMYWKEHDKLIHSGIIATGPTLVVVYWSTLQYKLWAAPSDGDAIIASVTLQRKVSANSTWTAV